MPLENTVRKGDVEVELEPRVMKLLCFMAENAGLVVSREQLISTIWSDVIVQEDSLTKVISELRRVLGDDTKEPKIIRTIRKGGYQLIADVEWQESKLNGTEATGNTRFMAWLVICTIMLLAGLFYIQQEGPNTAKLSLPPPEKIIRLTSYAGQELDPSLSHDGKNLVYVRNLGGILFDIYMLSLETNKSIRLTQSDFKDRFPRWSPNDQHIAFLREHENDSSLMMVNTSGGKPKTLATFNETGMGIDWSLDGKYLYFFARDNKSEPFSLYSLEVGSLVTQALTYPPSGFEGDRAVKVNPKTGQIGFFRHHRQGLMDFMILNDDGYASKQFSQQGANLSFSWSGDNIFFDSFTSGQYGIQFWNTDSGDISKITSLGNWTLYPDIHVQQKKMVFIEIQIQRNLVQRSLDNSHAEMKPLIDSSQINFDGHFNHAGNKVAYISAASGEMQLYVASSDGKLITQITNFDNALIASPQWSPDDKSILLQVNQTGSNKILYLDTETREKKVLIEDEFINVKPSWSVDGSSLFFSSNRSGDWQIWKKSATGDGLEQLTKNGGRVARAISDTHILFTKLDQAGLWLLEIDTQMESLFVPELSVNDNDNWSVSGDFAYYAVRQDSKATLYRKSLSSLEKAELFTLPNLADESLDVNLPNNLILYTQSKPIHSDILMAEWK